MDAMTPSDRAAIERVRERLAISDIVADPGEWAAVLEADLRILLALAERAVPREPTEAMKKAGDDAWNAHDQNDYVETCGAIWRAMHDAATDQPAQEKAAEEAPCSEPTDELRKRFERAMLDSWSVGGDYAFPRYPKNCGLPGRYRRMEVQHAWIAFRAGHAMGLEDQPRGSTEGRTDIVAAGHSSRVVADTQAGIKPGPLDPHAQSDQSAGGEG